MRRLEHLPDVARTPEREVVRQASLQGIERDRQVLLVDDERLVGGDRSERLHPAGMGGDGLAQPGGEVGHAPILPRPPARGLRTAMMWA